MQDMTSSICKDTIGRDGNTNQDASGSYIITPGSEPTKQLIDIRDGKEYWVAKLADGNCWMTQNLAYDLVKGKVLTPSDSDVSANWVVPEGTVSAIPARHNPAYTEAKSWNLGNYILAVPNRGVTCNSAPVNGSTNDQGYQAVRPGHTVGEDCKDFVDISTPGWSPTYNAETDGGYNRTWTGTNYNSTTKQMEPYTYNQSTDHYGFVTVEKGSSSAEAISKAASEGNSYDAHYLIGNYYQFNAATAGSSVNASSPTSAGTDASKLTDAPSSICPKGWQLPKSGRNTTTGLPFDRDDLYRLWLAYGYPQANQYESNNGNGITLMRHGSYLNGVLDTTNYSNLGVSRSAHQNSVLQPFYFVHSGYISLWDGAVSGMSGSSILLSSTTAPLSTQPIYVYVQTLSNSSIAVSTNYTRAEVMPMRCLAH